MRVTTARPSWARCRAVAVAGLAVAALALSACGNGSGSTGTKASETPSISVDSALAAKVPASIKSAGKITIGTDSTYAPSEFLASDGKTVQGFDVDLFNAVAAKLGLKTDWQPAKFASIIDGVASGRYNVGVSSFTVNADRMKQANMVSYFSAGTQWATQKGNPAKVNEGDPCGKKIAVQIGTVQLDDIQARQKKCTSSGKPMTIDQYQAQSDATTALVSGKDQAMLADSPVCAYAVKQTGGQLQLLGDIYEAAPYGYVLPKDQADFAQAVASAVKALISDGNYKKILSKWGVEAGAITDPQVNPSVSG
jgi:polar amino acid transport system substrate-binding protein